MVKKYCRKCSTNKSREDFYKNRASKDGLSSYCKSCMRSYRKKWEEDKPYYSTLTNQNSRAKKVGLPATWTYEELTETLDYFKGCALTGDTENVSWDHVIPLNASYGGTTSKNMIPIRNDLNASKGFNNLISWHRWAVDIYGLNPQKLDELLKYLADKNEMSIKEYRSYIDYDSSHLYEEWRNKISETNLKRNEVS